MSRSPAVLFEIENPGKTAMWWGGGVWGTQNLLETLRLQYTLYLFIYHINEQ